MRHKVKSLALMAAMVPAGVIGLTGIANAAVPNGAYCRTTQIIPGGDVYAHVCLNVYEQGGGQWRVDAQAWVTSNGTDHTFTQYTPYLSGSGGSDNGDYGGSRACQLPSHYVFADWECDNGWWGNGSYDGPGPEDAPYQQAQILINIDGHYYRAYSPTEYVH